MKKLNGYLRLMRPANIVTAVADVLAGIAISGFFIGAGVYIVDYADIVLLCISTIGLYGGGIVFNDVFDIELDRKERPERVIPSGLVSVKEATVLGSLLILLGIVSALLVGIASGILAMCIGFSALVYDKWGKHHPYLGPPNMGLCRGLNLLLGISILPIMLPEWWYLAIVPTIYISAITLISRGEVHGSSKKPLVVAAFLYVLVVGLILWFSWIHATILITIPFLLFFIIMIFRPLTAAMKTPTGPVIGKAVKAGVIALIVMNATWAAASGSWETALFVLFLLPLSVWLSHKFSVT